MAKHSDSGSGAWGLIPPLLIGGGILVVGYLLVRPFLKIGEAVGDVVEGVVDVAGDVLETGSGIVGTFLSGVSGILGGGGASCSAKWKEGLPVTPDNLLRVFTEVRAQAPGDAAFWAATVLGAYFAASTPRPQPSQVGMFLLDQGLGRDDIEAIIADLGARQLSNGALQLSDAGVRAVTKGATCSGWSIAQGREMATSLNRVLHDTQSDVPPPNRRDGATPRGVRVVG